MEAILACQSALCTVWVAGRHFRMNKSVFTPAPWQESFAEMQVWRGREKEREWEGEGVGIEALKTLPLSFSLRPSISKFLLHIANGRALMGSGCEFLCLLSRDGEGNTGVFPCFVLICFSAVCGWSWLFWDARMCSLPRRLWSAVFLSPVDWCCLIFLRITAVDNYISLLLLQRCSWVKAPSKCRGKAIIWLGVSFTGCS